ncbi:P-type DNA transfer ATPase VirB11 [Xanthobacter sp. V13C-7B]|uniref:P-type DNA transfer ATPase VirB11 n=1 Tax=Xanthobacter variabilis TaxID=3119932 RepID=UPI00372BA6A1
MSAKQDPSVLRAVLRPCAEFLSDPDLFEVVINQPGEVRVEGRGGWTTHKRPELTFEWAVSLSRAVATWSHQAISDTHPLLSATLPGGERIQIVVPPAVAAGTVSMTLRKPSATTYSLDELAGFGLFDAVRRADARSAADVVLLDLHRLGDWREFLRQAVLARKNIVISGATGSGKTTLSKALIAHIPPHERVISVEDAPELVIPQENNVRLFYSKGGQGVAKVGPTELLEACMRMRPDRILLQELRDGTAFDYIVNVNSGHPGSITTVHADSAALALERLTLLVKQSEGGRDLARDDVRGLLMTMVDVIVQCHKLDGRFRVTEVDFALARSSAGAPMPTTAPLLDGELAA